MQFQRIPTLRARRKFTVRINVNCAPNELDFQRWISSLVAGRKSRGANPFVEKN